MTDESSPPREPIAERLLATSRSFAQSAPNAYSTESWEVFFLHLATAVEHLAKAVLCRAHPSLMADTRADFDSLLHLSGHGDKAHRRSSVVRTNGAVDALERAGRLVDGYKQPDSEVRQLFEVRNGIAHAGMLAHVRVSDVLGSVAQFVKPCASAYPAGPTSRAGSRRRLAAAAGTSWAAWMLATLLALFHSSFSDKLSAPTEQACPPSSSHASWPV